MFIPSAADRWRGVYPLWSCELTFAPLSRRVCAAFSLPCGKCTILIVLFWESKYPDFCMAQMLRKVTIEEILWEITFLSCFMKRSGPIIAYAMNWCTQIEQFLHHFMITWKYIRYENPFFQLQNETVFLEKTPWATLWKTLRRSLLRERQFITLIISLLNLDREHFTFSGGHMKGRFTIIYIIGTGKEEKKSM